MIPKTISFTFFRLCRWNDYL